MERDTVPPSALAKQTAFRFVREWTTGQRPLIETALASVPPSQRPSLFESLFIVEINARKLLGEAPSSTEYLSRFPQFHATITNAIASLPPNVKTPIPAPIVVPVAPLPVGVQPMPVAMPMHQPEHRPNAFEFGEMADETVSSDAVWADRQSRKMTWLIGLSFVGVLGLGVASSILFLPNFRKQSIEEPPVEIAEKTAIDVSKSTSTVIETRDIDMGGPKSAGDPEQNITDWIREIGGSGVVLTEQGGKVRFLSGQNMPKTGKFTVEQITLDSQAAARWNNRSVARFSELKNLRKLELYRDTELSDETLTPLVNGSKLRQLELRGNSLLVTGEGIARFAELEGLVINNAPSFGDPDCAALAKLVNLQALEINGTKITPLGFGHLGKLAKLKTIVFGADLTLSPDHIRRLQTAPIEEIRSQNGLADEIFREFAVFPNMRKYVLRQTTITSNGLKAVAGQLQLEELTIVGSGITGEGLSHLANLESLTTLDLSGAKIEGDVLDPIAKLPNLKTLRLAGNPLLDAQVAKLAAADGLEVLDLSKTKITDGTLGALKKHQKLKRLIVKGTTVTAGGIKDFTMGTPQCAVEK